VIKLETIPHFFDHLDTTHDQTYFEEREIYFVDLAKSTGSDETFSGKRWISAFA
jgi:hypothetical protein